MQYVQRLRLKSKDLQAKPPGGQAHAQGFACRQIRRAKLLLMRSTQLGPRYQSLRRAWVCRMGGQTQMQMPRGLR